VNIQERKAAARKTAFAARKQAHELDRDADACARLWDYLNTLSGVDCFAGYMPIRTEISPLPVMERLCAAGKTVCVPVIQGAGMPLHFCRWKPDMEMTEGPFGARIPLIEEFLDPDVLITPLVAFDANGYRLGYGGGFYDRSFQGLRRMNAVVGVGFAYDGQELEHLPIEQTDQKLDAIVTPNRILTF